MEGSLVGFVVLLYAAAYLLIPKDWVQRQALRQAAKVQGATVRWDRLSVGFSGFSLGAHLEGVALRIPAEGEGDARVQARSNHVFIRFKLLPLLTRRVLVDAADVSGGGIALIERAEAPPSGGEAARHPKFALYLPRLDFHDVAVRSRDAYGSGIDLRDLKGYAEFSGTVDRPRAIRILATADSIFWKPSAGGAAVALPSPLKADLAVRSRERGHRLEVTQGDLTAGPLEGQVRGSIRLPEPATGEEPELALLVTGKPQRVASEDKAFRGLARLSPATWATTASFQLQITGKASKPVQTGRFTLKPFAVRSAANRFSLEQVLGSWSTATDRTYAIRADGAGSGVAVALDANGSSAPGGSTRATVVIRAPASRLNGVVANMPEWSSGMLELRGLLALDPPAPPSIRWSMAGRGLSGAVKGFRRPVSRLDFDLEGDQRSATIHSMDAVVGSTHASVTGTFNQGKPLGTGTFRANLDRFVAEEWAPVPGKENGGGAGAAAGGAPLPLKAFDGTVSIGEVRSGKMLIRNVVAPMKYAEGRIVASPITGAIGTGSISGVLDIEKAATSPSYTLNVTINRVPVQEFVSSVMPMKLGLNGYTTGSFHLAGEGLPGFQTGSMQGGIKGVVEDGQILETPAIIRLRQALGLLSGSAGGAEPALPDLTFKALSYAARVNQGRFLVDQVEGEIGKDLLQLSGSAGFDRTIDLNILLRLASSHIKPGTFLAKFANYARDEQGRLPIKIRMTGNTLTPQFTVSPASTIQAVGRGLAEEALKRMLTRARADSARAAKSESARASAAASDTSKKASTPDSAKVPESIRKAQEALKRLLGK
jgi:hypothetical protein